MHIHLCFSHHSKLELWSDWEVLPRGGGACLPDGHRMLKRGNDHHFVNSTSIPIIQNLGSLKASQTSNICLITAFTSTHLNSNGHASTIRAPRPHKYTPAELDEIRKYQELRYGDLIRMLPIAKGVYPSGDNGTPWWKNKQYYDPETLAYPFASAQYWPWSFIYGGKECFCRYARLYYPNNRRKKVSVLGYTTIEVGPNTTAEAFDKR